MANIKQQEAVAAEVFAALESGKLELPTLPDIAINIRETIEDPNVSAEKIIRLLSADPAISAQIIKTANSAAFSNGFPVNDLRSAISRLGYRMLHNLVMLITMSNLFKASSPIINQELKDLWDHSREVAANSYVLALHQKHLKPEQALLAGLVHDLGALPLCIYADHHHPRLDKETLEGLIRKFHTEVGARLLSSWHFPDNLVEIVAEHENLQRMTAGGVSDYIDVVTVANMMMPATAKFVAWENVRAIGRLGYTPAQCQNFLARHEEQLSIAREMLGFPRSNVPKQATATSSVVAKPIVPAPEENPDSTSGVLSGLFKLFR
ncbi:HDOD domain-containing protein [Sideroxydans lithotrophicus]|uniref:Putative signal transduction protein n=1 Tax=Sideroxydans lithotrophicus (strain ES-1) TaxID=580332 RepID=D5CST1_SIDLE|nr:HDOD domain-containing protein [Sideroxydans lithotrophicus]ADE12017.1 putative signal transduction protein [Sideroxydans lithotrophicus ES-1]